MLERLVIDLRHALVDASPPPVVRWYRRYCAVVASAYAFASLASGGIFQGRTRLAEATDQAPSVFIVFAVLWALVMLFLALVHVAALLTPRAPYAWKVHAVIIGLGMTTLVLWPISMPLLYFWLKRETRVWFGDLPNDSTVPAAESAASDAVGSEGGEDGDARVPGRARPGVHDGVEPEAVEDDDARA